MKPVLKVFFLQMSNKPTIKPTIKPIITLLYRWLTAFYIYTRLVTILGGGLKMQPNKNDTELPQRFCRANLRHKKATEILRI